MRVGSFRFSPNQFRDPPLTTYRLFFREPNENFLCALTMGKGINFSSPFWLKRFPSSQQDIYDARHGLEPPPPSLSQDRGLKRAFSLLIPCRLFLPTVRAFSPRRANHFFSLEKARVSFLSPHSRDFFSVNQSPQTSPSNAEISGGILFFFPNL